MPFPGIRLELMNNCPLAQKSQLSFAGAGDIVLFSLRLAGTGSMLLHGRTDNMLHSSGQLAVCYVPACRGAVTFQPGTYSFVNVLACREVLSRTMPEQTASVGRLLRMDEQEGYVLRMMTASTALMLTASQLFTPPSSEYTQHLFVQGGVLKFIALAIDTLHAFLLHGDTIRLTRKDITTLSRVKTYLENNIVEPPSLEVLCKKFYINSFKLKKGFKQIYGMAISRYIQFYRLHSAYSRFLTGDTNVSECAWAVGYTNVSHFIAAFRRQFGFTPGECIRNHKEGLSCLHYSRG